MSLGFLRPAVEWRRIVLLYAILWVNERLDDHGRSINSNRVHKFNDLLLILWYIGKKMKRRNGL